MSDVDTGANPFPSSLGAGGVYSHKSNAANSTAREYQFFADSRVVLYASGAQSSASAPRGLHGFGEAVPLSLTDSFCSFVSGCHDSNVLYSAAFSLDFNGSTGGGSNVRFFAASSTGLGGPVLTNVWSFTGTGLSGADPVLGAFPGIDGGLLLSRRYFTEGGNSTNTSAAAVNTPRCLVPGLFSSPQSGLAAIFSVNDTTPGAGDLAGRTLVVVPTANGPSSADGRSFVDITGPWR